MTGSTNASSDAAALASVTSSIEDLERRVLALSRAYEAAKRGDVSAPLENAERALRTAAREVTTAVRRLRA